MSDKEKIEKLEKALAILDESQEKFIYMAAYSIIYYPSSFSFPFEIPITIEATLDNFASSIIVKEKAIRNGKKCFKSALLRLYRYAYHNALSHVVHDDFKELGLCKEDLYCFLV